MQGPNDRAGSRMEPIGALKSAIHGATGLLGVRITRTGYGAIGWATVRSPLLARVFGHPHVFVPDSEHRFRWLQGLGIKSVLDVGAHEGGFAREIRRILPSATIHSFEPLPDCFRALEQASRNEERHHVMNVALGAERGRALMHQNEFSPASSLLATAEGMRQQLPFATQTREVEVAVETLDGVVASLDLEREWLVKIDVQGFERQVIAGGRDTLRQARVVIVETSFQPIYRNQPLFDAVYADLVALGLRYAGSWDRQQSPIDGAPLQEDSLFVRG